MKLFDPVNTPLSPPEFPEWETLDPEVKREEILRMQVYAAMVDRVDQSVGRLLAKLKEIDRLGNTLILFASDNGASSEVVNKGTGEIGQLGRWASQLGRWANVSNTPLRKFKNFSYEGGIKTPMIAWWPGKVAAGSISGFPAHFIDIMPTFVELAGARYPDRVGDTPITPMQGVSLVPALMGAAVRRESPLYWQWAQGRAVREGKWKLISQGNRQPAWELYDMRADRSELIDLAREFPARVERMARMWQAWYDGCAATPAR
jgi:arylsulfatase